MTQYPKDTIRELEAGTLPWPQTRRIMSAYKNENRFFTYLEVLQERVAWDDRILLPISNKLFIAKTLRGWVVKCECGCDFGSHRQNWKLKANIRVRRDEASLQEIYPNNDIPDPGWTEIREFICPDCGTLHEVEACTPGYPIVHDFEPDLKGFYRDWLRRPLPSEVTACARLPAAPRSSPVA